MKNLTISVKGEGSGEAWSHSSVSTLGANNKGEPSPSYVAKLESHHENNNEIHFPEQKQEELQELEAEAPATSVTRGRTRPVETPNLRDLKEKLGIDFDTCLGKTKTNERCKNRILKKNLAVAERILADLENGHSVDKMGSPSKHLKTLAELLHCKSRHQENAPLLCKEWEIILGLCTEPVPAQESVASRPVKVSQTIPTTKAAIPNIVFDTSRINIRKFVPYDARAQTMKSMESFVEGAVMANLGKQEIEKAGRIYIYWFPGNFGYLKIGVTSRAVEVRLREWENKCSHKTLLDHITTLPVPHVFRVEKIVQASLRDRRRKEMGCTGCGRCHDEWFEVFKQEAIAEVEKWSGWMRSNPYEELANGEWRLKKGEKANIKTLCQNALSEKQKKSISTSHLKEREERNRRLSVSPHPHRGSDSAEGLRRSPRLTARQRRKSSAGSEVSEASVTWTLKLETQP